MGVSKTRLARDISLAHAARVARGLTRKTLATVYPDPRWECQLHIAPAKYLHRNWGGLWPSGVARTPQVCGGLGTKLTHALATSGAQQCVIIGTDCPELTRADIADAFAALKRHDAVIGPAKDGGFYLLGLKKPDAWRGLFDGVRWSSDDTLLDLMRNIPPMRKVCKLRPLADIDTGDDYKTWQMASK